MRDGEGLFEAEPVEKKRPRVRAAAAVDKRFRAFDPRQALLLPPLLDDWLPEACGISSSAGLALASSIWSRLDDGPAREKPFHASPQGPCATDADRRAPRPPSPPP
ncbi:hypothetical protein ACFCWD_19020 [Streptomyces sp. NPDC056374]|uniref:hypothetical protein n=1 Tax=unclassified Streptomyces TaxID=2593676 RepID=UPI0035DCB4DA